MQGRCSLARHSTPLNILGIFMGDLSLGLLLPDKHLDQGSSGKALGALQREPEGAIPDKTGESAESSAHSKEDSVVILLN